MVAIWFLEVSNFQIKQGEIFALLGVKTGKTTTLECIEGLRKYDEGTIVVNGKTGIQLQFSSLPVHIKPMEAIKLFAKWNHTYIDDAMLKALGIKRNEGVAIHRIIHRSKKKITSCSCTYQ